MVNDAPKDDPSNKQHKPARDTTQDDLKRLARAQGTRVKKQSASAKREK